MSALTRAELLSLMKNAEVTLRENEKLLVELRALKERFEREWPVDQSIPRRKQPKVVN